MHGTDAADAAGAASTGTAAALGNDNGGVTDMDVDGVSVGNDTAGAAATTVTAATATTAAASSSLMLPPQMGSGGSAAAGNNGKQIADILGGDKEVVSPTFLPPLCIVL